MESSVEDIEELKERIVGTIIFKNSEYGEKMETKAINFNIEETNDSWKCRVMLNQGKTVRELDLSIDDGKQKLKDLAKDIWEILIEGLVK